VLWATGREVVNFLNIKETDFINTDLSPETFKKLVLKSALVKTIPLNKSSMINASNKKRTLNLSPMVGTVKEWNDATGVGSIMPEGEMNSLYVSRRSLLHRGNNAKRSLYVGENVAFNISKKNTAICIVRIPPLRRFAIIDNEDYLIRELAEIKILPGECWDYKHHKKQIYPVLRTYIYDVFSRLEQEDCEQTDEKLKKIRIGRRNKKHALAIFDTGLVNRMYLRIYAVFKETDKHEIGKPFWTLIGFCSPGERLNGIDYLKCFKELPDSAESAKDPAELVYNPKLHLDLSLKRISQEELRRWPESIRKKIPPDMREPGQIVDLLNKYLQPAIERALRRLHWDSKTAVPRYSFSGKHIELLLPLCFYDQNRVDCALAIQKQNQSYVYSTILSLDRAYSCARVIAPPHSDWLDPKVFF